MKFKGFDMLIPLLGKEIEGFKENVLKKVLRLEL